MTIEDTTTPECLSSLMKPVQDDSISVKGLRFVDEYLIDLNASRASRAAGYKGNTFPTEPAVIVELQRRQKEMAKTLHISATRVLKEYARCAFLDVSQLFNADGTPKEFMRLSDDVRAAISAMDVETQGKDKNWKTVTKYKFVSKLTALEALGKHLGLFPKEAADTGNNNAAGAVSEMSENEQARRISHILHSAMTKQQRVLGDVEEAEIIEG